MDVKIEESWKKHLKNEFEKPYFESLINFVKVEYQTGVCYPPGKLIFNAFDKCNFDKTRVIILGQDPYHGPRQANGLSFSVNDGVTFPPSLIWSEIFVAFESTLFSRSSFTTLAGRCTTSPAAI